MKKSLIVPIILAIFSHAHSISLGEILGMRRRWHDATLRTPTEPEVIEIVRWRQPVCVVPDKDVPPCITTLHKFQNDYQRNSAGGIEDARNEKIPKKIVNDPPGVLTPEVVDSFEFENVASVKIESSEESGRSFDRAVTLNLRSRTPEVEVPADSRSGKYLSMSSFGKSTTVVHESPQAIYVTKVMNSPVTATLVAKNCFPDMGVPLCDNYQETITIYRDPVSSQSGERESTIENTDLVADETKTSADGAKENTGSPDFSSDPSNPNFDDRTSHSDAQRPSGLLGQAIQHVIDTPGVISASPTGIIDVIANKAGILGGFEDTDESRESSSIGSAATTVIEPVIKPQVVVSPDDRRQLEVTSSTSRPGLIGSFLDIQRPAIFENLFSSGLGIFNKSTTPKPEANVNVGGGSSLAGSQSSGELHGQAASQGIGQGQVIQAIQNFVNRPDKVSTNAKPEFKPILVVEPTRKPSLLEAFWRPGGLGIFNKVSVSSTSKPDGGAADGKILEDEQTESARPDSSVVPAGPQLGEASSKVENDEGKPTVATGLDGYEGLFKNPVKPNALENVGVDNTKTALGTGSSIFSRPNNKPLIIERPGAKPLLVEKPIYVQEKPAQSAGLLNFFIPASDKPVLSVAHEVIHEPVYVYQKPQTSSGILNSVFGENLSVPGFFQGWAIFGNGGEKKVEQNQSIGDAVEVSRTGEVRSAVGLQSATSTIDETSREDPESTATESTPLKSADTSSESVRSEDSIDEEAIEEIVEALEEEGIEEAPKSYVGENDPESEVIKILLPEEITVGAAKVDNPETQPLDGPGKSVSSLEEIPDDIASEVNAELTGPIEIVKTTPKSVEENSAVEKSSIDLSESLPSDGTLEKIEDATSIKEIVEETERNLSPQSANVVNEKIDDPDDESTIGNDA